MKWISCFTISLHLIIMLCSEIGKATATKFINNGAKTAKELEPNATFITCDVTQESDISNAVDFAISKYKQLDIMYNNAGIACRSPLSIVDLDLELFDKVMDINVRGIVAGVKHSACVMIPRGSDTLTISKFAVIGIVKSLASGLCRHRIRVNCISPFAIPTPFFMGEMSQIYPHGVNCEPNDIANTALFLASDDAKYVSGHNLVVDGGFTSFKNLEFPAPDQVQ
ncbi:hypothetical protein AAZX31_19G192900 [Glycine max]